MLLTCIRYVLGAFLVLNIGCGTLCIGQFVRFKQYEQTSTPLPFPSCRADNIECLRRGFRTFFFLMDSKHLDMKPIDPALINSVIVSLPEQQISILLRNLNVTGARWTKLAERKFHLTGGKSSVKFLSDLHVTGEITMTDARKTEPNFSFITMDIQEVESNITYPWSSLRGIDGEDYILIGQERITVRNSRTPTYFLQPYNKDAQTIDDTLQLKTSIIDNLSNEIVAALMSSVVDNFRLFASRVPVKHFYQYY